MFPLQSKFMHFSGRPKLAAIILHGVIVLLAPAFTATANAATCSQLKHQLATVEQSKTGSNKYQRAANRQLKQLNILKKALTRTGCIGQGALTQSRKLNCAELLKTKSRMETRLYSLRDRAGGGGSHAINRKRRKIKLSMRRQRCGFLSVGVKPKKNRKQTLVKAIYGNVDSSRQNRAAVVPEKRRRKSNRKRRIALNRYFSPGTPVKAVCVRTCDGYKFPVNFSSRKGDFDNASDVCRTMCPGAKMALYLRRSSKKSTNDLYSAATGEPYAALPTSFAFQKNFNPNCTCNYKLLNRNNGDNQNDKTSLSGVPVQKEPEVKTTIPVRRIDRGQDPETIHNLAGGWSLKMAQNIKAGFKEKVVTNIEPKKVRIIGDKYYPGQ